MWGLLEVEAPEPQTAVGGASEQDQAQETGTGISEEEEILGCFWIPIK